MKLLVLSIFLSLGFLSSAQHKNHYGREHHRLTFGIEQDVLPYVLGGYIGTGWIGKGYVRSRFSYASAKTPGFILQDNVNTDEVKAFGLSFEYFARGEFEGFWIGPGIGHWTNTITFYDGIRARNESLIFTLGGGYNFNLTNWLYVSPWAALHTRITGTDQVTTFLDPLHVYQPSRFTPEISAKIGIKLFKKRTVYRFSK